MILHLFCFHIGTILYRNCAENRIAKRVCYTSLEFPLFSVFAMKLKPRPKYYFIFGLFNITCRFRLITSFLKLYLLLFDLKNF